MKKEVFVQKNNVRIQVFRVQDLGFQEFGVQVFRGED